MTDDEIIDKVLNRLNDFNRMDIDSFISTELNILDKSRWIIIKDLMITENLIIPTAGTKGIVLAPYGREVLKNGGWLKLIKDKKDVSNFQKEKSDLEFRKSTVEFKIAESVLKDLPKTQKRANIGYIIAIVLAIVQIAQWIIELLSISASD